jgi:hypothetical protein
LNDFIEIETSIILELIPEREKKIFIKLLKWLWFYSVTKI